MKYEDFVCAVQTEMKKRMGEEVHVDLHQIVKNNSVTLDGLSIQEKHSGIAPTIYLNDFYMEYQRGMTMPEILDSIENVYQKSRLEEKFDIEFYTDYERVKSHLACKVISREKNEKLLEKVPYIPFLDLAVVCYYKMTEGAMANGTILVFDSHRKNWGISREQLFREAKENTLQILPTEFMSIECVLEGVKIEEIPGETPTPMYILTNTENYFGAVNMIFDPVLEEAGEKMGEDFWILPSSIHECILVPVSVHMKKERLETMVRQINATEVAPEDFLSDSVYFYQRSLHKLEKM